MTLPRTLPLLLICLLIPVSGEPAAQPSVPELKARKAELETKAAKNKDDWKTGFKLRFVTELIKALEEKKYDSDFCRYQMRCLGTAAEMESTKNNHHYPGKMTRLVSSYFDVLPTCPSGAAYTYKMILKPRDEYDITCPTHGYTYNTLAGFR